MRQQGHTHTHHLCHHYTVQWRIWKFGILESKIWNLEFGIWNLECGIQNLESEIIFVIITQCSGYFLLKSEHSPPFAPTL